MSHLQEVKIITKIHFQLSRWHMTPISPFKSTKNPLFFQFMSFVWARHLGGVFRPNPLSLGEWVGKNTFMAVLCVAKIRDSWHRQLSGGISFSGGEGVESLLCKGRKSLRNNPRCPRLIKPRRARPSGSDGEAMGGNLTPSERRGREARNDGGDSQSR